MHRPVFNNAWIITALYGVVHIGICCERIDHDIDHVTSTTITIIVYPLRSTQTSHAVRMVEDSNCLVRKWEFVHLLLEDET